MKLRTFAAALAAHAALTSAASALDSALPAYQPTGSLSGELQAIGSDTLNHEMELWAAGFKAKYPNVKIQIEGKGSATAPPALVAGTAQLGPMSRVMNGDEVGAFEKKYGYKPTSIGVAADSLAIYVNKENPIHCITLEQINGIFSKTHKVSGGDDIDSWGQLGLTGEWAKQPISMYGRNTISGTYEFFKDHELYGGDFKESVQQQVGSEAVVQKIANDKYGIGYSGIGYKSEGVRAIPVAVHYGQQCYNPSQQDTLAGKYPIARLLYIYINKKPGEPLEPIVAEFLKYVLSKDGQAQTEKGGYYPLSAEIAASELQRLEPTKPTK
ncbi:MAG: phosphate ABC transporter substrate-binding protein [Methylocystis sp.]